MAGCAVPLAAGKAPPELQKILASHRLLHTAEGEMFREALVWAAKECPLPATGVRRNSPDPTALQRISILGEVIGPPWTQDHKYATVAALIALGNPPE